MKSDSATKLLLLGWDESGTFIDALSMSIHRALLYVNKVGKHQDFIEEGFLILEIACAQKQELSLFIGADVIA